MGCRSFSFMSPPRMRCCATTVSRSASATTWVLTDTRKRGQSRSLVDCGEQREPQHHSTCSTGALLPVIVAGIVAQSQAHPNLPGSTHPTLLLCWATGLLHFACEWMMLRAHVQSQSTTSNHPVRSPAPLHRGRRCVDRSAKTAAIRRRAAVCVSPGRLQRLPRRVLAGIAGAGGRPRCILPAVCAEFVRCQTPVANACPLFDGDPAAGCAAAISVALSFRQ